MANQDTSSSLQLSRIDGIRKSISAGEFFDMGGGDLQDVLAAADWIQQTGYVIPKNSSDGGSYGGYLTMMGVTKAPEVWAAAFRLCPL